MDPAGRKHNAPTIGDHDAAVHTPMLSSYRRPSTTPLDEHLLDKQPEQQSAQYWLPSFCCRPKTGDDGQAAITMDSACVRRTCKAWLKNPMNIALLLWLLCVGISGGMLVLLLLGLLDGTFPASASRNRWIETNNQVLNALFTLMSVYQHPALCHHLFLLCRWRPNDAAELRAAYCKDGSTARRGERFHLGVVVALLQLTVACQYVLCGLYWGYDKATRPELLEDGFFVLGVAAPVAAAAYTACSPLGKSDQPDLFLSLSSDATDIEEEKPTMEERNAAVVVVEPEWAGGMFDCCSGGDAAASWCLSVSCTFCVFGWNAERLGLGNRYVHAATFALLCFAPLWVLAVSALHIHNLLIGDVVGGAGVVLCACGLLYGGYWRIQMRRRFGLPGSKACCGSKSITDYARWLFCWPCALAQEVRTASRYHIDGETFYYSKSSKVVVHGDDDHEEERTPLLKCSTNHDVSCARRDTTVVAVVSPNHHHLVVIHDDVMVPPPVQVVVVQVEDDDKPDQCSVVPHGEMIDSSLFIPGTAQEQDESLVEIDSISSDGSWRVEKVKKLINVFTMLSLLILLYTRGFIR